MAWVPLGPSCEAAEGPQVRHSHAVEVRGPYEIKLADGRHIKLAGFKPPEGPEGRELDRKSLETALKEELHRRIEGRELLYILAEESKKGVPTPAYVFEGTTFINGEWIAAGLAVLEAGSREGAYGRYLTALENQAREQRRGLWNEDASSANPLRGYRREAQPKNSQEAPQSVIKYRTPKPDEYRVEVYGTVPAIPIGVIVETDTRLEP